MRPGGGRRPAAGDDGDQHKAAETAPMVEAAAQIEHGCGTDGVWEAGAGNPHKTRDDRPGTPGGGEGNIQTRGDGRTGGAQGAGDTPQY